MAHFRCGFVGHESWPSKRRPAAASLDVAVSAAPVSRTNKKGSWAGSSILLPMSADGCTRVTRNDKDPGSAAVLAD